MGIVRFTVGQDNIVDAFIYTFFCLLAQRGNSFLQTVSSFGSVVEHRKLYRFKSFVANVAKQIQLCIGQYGVIQSYHLAMLCIGSQDIHAYSSDIFGERHDQFFADRIDRRVGDLGKLLAEIVEQQLWPVAQYSQGSIVTHGTYRFCTILGHRLNDFLNIFPGISKNVEHVVIMRHAMCDFSSTFQFVQLNTVAGKPCTIGLGFGQLAFQFIIIVNPSFLCVNQQDFSRLEASFFFDVTRFEIHHTYLTGHYHRVILGNEVACRAESVPVKHTAGISAVAEEQRSRTVPWFHQNGMIFVKSLQVFTDGVLFVERFGYEHGHGMRQAHA